MLRQLPNCFFCVAGQAVVEEVHIEVCDDFSIVENAQPMGIGEGAKHGSFNRFRLTDCHQFLQILRWYGDYHPFLRFGKPNLPRVKIFIFERYIFQMHICTCLLTHLTDGGGKSTGTTIRDIAIELAIPCTHQGIDNFLLHNRVANLHDAAKAFGGIVQLQRGERCPVNAIAPGAPTESDNQIAGLHRFIAPILGNQTDVATIDEWIPCIAWVEQDCTVSCRNPHTVAVVSHTRDNAFENPFRMECAFGKFVVAEIGKTETENIRVQNRLRAKTCAERVPNHPTDACACAAIRLDCGGVIMRFDLENDIILIIKLNDACVVRENGDTPLRPNLLRRPLDVRLEQSINHLRLSPFFSILNHALKCFVDAML